MQFKLNRKSENELETVKAILLKELNQRRTIEGRVPLAKFPETGCTHCGDAGEGPLQESAVTYLRTCQTCVLKRFPFQKLRLPAGETITWFRSDPTFHRSSEYGMLLTDQAFYLYSPFWLTFSKWRRIPLSEIQSVAFHDSRFFPTLRVHLNHGTAVLRTPLDYADEMKFDRRNLIEAAERLRESLAKRGQE